VVGPSYVDIRISANLALLDDSPPEDALDDAQRRLRAYLDPLDWPFGQAVHPSEVYAVLEPSSLIDYIEDVQVSGPPVGTDGGIELDVHQLPRLSGGNLVAYDSYGRTHPRTWGTQS
jgi:phage-related baseplate assembly protein